jgi:hypothetical protein
MTEVVDLGARREARKPENCYTYTCAQCASQTFMLRPDAKIQCAGCERIEPRLIWGEFFRSETINPPDQT